MVAHNVFPSFGIYMHRYRFSAPKIPFIPLNDSPRMNIYPVEILYTVNSKNRFAIDYGSNVSHLPTGLCIKGCLFQHNREYRF
ncbi:MAG: hypothetical protein PHR28_15015, partial [candidate division Zixibacteria bacterium]|nr:hypothetical protein [candidate division Zixibacteria bacterium]